MTFSLTFKLTVFNMCGRISSEPLPKHAKTLIDLVLFALPFRHPFSETFAVLMFLCIFCGILSWAFAENSWLKRNPCFPYGSCWKVCSQAFFQWAGIVTVATRAPKFHFWHELVTLMDSSIRGIFIFGNWAGAWKNDNTVIMIIHSSKKR